MRTWQAILEDTGEIPLRRLLKEALRMRPDRIVVGELSHLEVSGPTAAACDCSY